MASVIWGGTLLSGGHGDPCFHATRLGARTKKIGSSTSPRLPFSAPRGGGFIDSSGLLRTVGSVRRLRCDAIGLEVGKTKVARETLSPVKRKTLIERIDDNIWCFTQPLILEFFANIGLDPLLRMTAIRLEDGSVWIHSPVALTEEVADTLASIGPVKHLVISNLALEHSMFIGAYINTFPEATIYAPVPRQGLPIPARFRVKESEELGEDPPEAWLGAFEQHTVSLVGGIFKETIFFHKPTSTLFFSDLLLQGDDDFVKSPFNKWSLEVLNMYKKPAGALVTIFQAENERKRNSKIFDLLQSWDYNRIIFSHLSSPLLDAKPTLNQAFKVIQ